MFVLATDVLQAIVNKAKNLGLLKLPLTHMGDQNFPVIQYADDTILVMEACPKQPFFLKAVLNSLADSMGLYVNYHKSNIYPINVSDDKMNILCKDFQLQYWEFPFHIFRDTDRDNQTKVGFLFFLDSED